MTYHRYLRYTFPGDVPDDGFPGPERRARAMAALFLDIPAYELTVGRLDSAAIMLTDRGILDYTDGDPMGEELADWLRLIVGPGGRRAYLDIDLDEMARVQVRAERERQAGVS